MRDRRESPLLAGGGFLLLHLSCTGTLIEQAPPAIESTLCSVESHSADRQLSVDGHEAGSLADREPTSYRNGHAASSDPLDEQRFLVETINRLQQTPDWKDTAVVIAYDDSDGWYDHQMSPIVNDSQSPQDALTDDGRCGGRNPMAGAQDRCGYGPRQPLLLLSPYSKVNAVGHQITDQTSVLRFIEDNWLGGQRIGDGSLDTLAGSLDGLFDFAHRHQRPLYLDPTTGRPGN